jgi:protein phosphatase
VAAQVVHSGWDRLFQQTRQKNNALMSCSDLDLPIVLQQLIQEAHEHICAEGVRRVRNDNPPSAQVRYPKTTTVLATFCHYPDKDSYTLVSAHVGDSRIYLLRGKNPLIRLTQDDSLLTWLVQDKTISQTDALRIDQAMDSSQLSEVELEYFNKRYGVTQMLGDEKLPTIHVQQTTLLPGDCILLCSDGIHDNLLDQEIEEILRGNAGAIAARLLVESAMQRAYQDSKTTIRAKMDDMSALIITYHN